MGVHIDEESHIPKIEQLTNNITNNLKREIEVGKGLILKCMTDFHDSQDMVIVTVTKDLEEDTFKTLHINKYGKSLMMKNGVNPSEFDTYCLGTHPDYDCPMHGNCTAHKVWKEGKYSFRKNVIGPITGESYDVLLFPLKFNGTKAVVEFWIPSECDI